MQAAAMAHAAFAQLGGEQRAMPFLVGDELVDLGCQGWRSPTRDPALRSVDGNRAMFAGMVDLYCHLAGCIGGS